MTDTSKSLDLHAHPEVGASPADDALRAAVESARLKVDVATSYLADAYQSQRQSADLVAELRDELVALLSALTAPPDTRQSVTVTEEMVERGARAMRDEALLYRVSQIQGFVNHPRDDRHWIRDLTLPPGDQVIWDGGPSSDEMMEALEHIKAKHFARAVLAAAGEGV